MKLVHSIPLLVATLFFGACQPGNSALEISSQKGNYSIAYVRNLQGFAEIKNQIIAQNDMSPRDFLLWSTDSAWSLKPAEQLKLKAVRDAVSKPNTNVLLQKIIPLEEIPIYLNNTYGGTIGGFVAVAGDVRQLRTMSDVYLGLRLDYPGTKFSKVGAGYGVVRFFSPSADRLTIPYCAELGGTQPHAWPNGGGGFTTSLLADGGVPEWKSIGYDAPLTGAEIYEVTPQGREILRSIYKKDRWEVYEDQNLPTKSYRDTNTQTIRNGTYTTKSGQTEFIQTICTYQNHTFTVRAIIGDIYHLTTDINYSQIPLRTIEKGIWGIEAPANQITELKEITL